jgi:WD40 repeat protein
MNTLFFPGKKLAYFPAGKLAVGCDSGDIVLWDPASDSIKTLQGHTDFITSIHLAPDGKTLVSGSYDGSVVVWNPVD